MTVDTAMLASAGLRLNLDDKVNAIMIHHCHLQILEICHIFKAFISCFYTMILPCILVTRHEHIFVFTVFTSRPVPLLVSNMSFHVLHQ
jgi:hypothetical protein